MKTCYCRKCGTANEVDEMNLTYTCISCGVENNVPKPKTQSVPVEQPVSDSVETTYNSDYNPFATAAGTVDNTYNKAYNETAAAETDAPEKLIYNYSENMTKNISDNVSDNKLTQAKVKRKKTGLVVFLVLFVLVIGAAAVLMFTPVNSPLPVKMRCDDCGKIRFSQKYEITYEAENKVKSHFICDECFEDGGYLEQN